MPPTFIQNFNLIFFEKIYLLIYTMRGTQLLTNGMEWNVMNSYSIADSRK